MRAVIAIARAIEAYSYNRLSTCAAFGENRSDVGSMMLYRLTAYFLNQEPGA